MYIELLRDISLSNKDIAEKIGKSEITIFRWRKKLGIKNILGSKKGKSRPWQQKLILKTCKICGIKTENTPSYIRTYCSRKCMNSDPDYIQKLKETDRSYMKTEKYSLSKQNPLLSKYKKYYGKVTRLSEKVYNQFEKEINPNGYKRTRAGLKNGYHLDHIISVKYGFMNNINPEIIADKSNLQILPWKENISKGWKREKLL